MGTWEVLSEGESLAILAVGSMVEESQKAIAMLDQAVTKPCLVNARFIKPLDETILRKILKKFETVLTIEEGILAGGFGSSVLTWLHEHGYKGNLYRLGIPDEFVDHGSRKTILGRLGISARKISETITRIDSRKKVRVREKRFRR